MNHATAPLETITALLAAKPSFTILFQSNINEVLLAALERHAELANRCPPAVQNSVAEAAAGSDPTT